MANNRKNIIYDESDMLENVKNLVDSLYEEGFVFNTDLDPLAEDLDKTDRLLVAGLGVKDEDIDMIIDLSNILGASLATTKPGDEIRNFVPDGRYIGMDGEKFNGQLYVSIGSQGAPNHMMAVNGAKCIVGINKEEYASIFDYADYGIVGDYKEVIPLLIEEFNNRKN